MPPNHGNVHNFFTLHPLTLKNISTEESSLALHSALLDFGIASTTVTSTGPPELMVIHQKQ